MPEKIGKVIRRLRIKAGMTQDELAEKVGRTRPAVTAWESNRSQPDTQMLRRLADLFGVSVSELMGESPAPIEPIGTSAMVPVRVLGATHAGDAMDEDECDRVVEVPRCVVERHPDGFLLRVEGDCMDRRFPEGCLVLVDPRMEPRNGLAVVAEFPDGRSVLRCYLRGQSALMLTADSFSPHDDIIVTEGDGAVRTVGVAVWFQAAEDVRG